MLASATAEYQNTGTGAQKVKEIRIDRPGVLRITWSMRGNQSQNNTGCVWSRVYRNDEPVGEHHSQCNNNTWMSITENIDGWSAGDKVQLYCGAQGGYPNRCSVKDFSIGVANEIKHLQVLLDKSN